MIEQESKREALAELSALAAASVIEVYSPMKADFGKRRSSPERGSARGEEIRILPEKGKRVSVFGLLNPGCEGRFWAQEKAINTGFVIECLEEWMKEKGEKPRVLVLDNAKIHRSKLMTEKMAEWEEKGFYIFFLPPYSPHLNIIEILWRKMKYEWLKPQDYLSFESLMKAIKEILSNVGTEYKINFRDRVFIK